jgi:8-oxo-dGTP pyrophosphatase MutT (NUDIX family)
MFSQKNRRVHSYGLIVFRRNFDECDGYLRPPVDNTCTVCSNPREVVFRQMEHKCRYSLLVMQKKNTHSFCDIVMGKVHIKTLPRIIDELTCQEKKRLLTWDFGKLWASLWAYHSEKRASTTRDFVRAKYIFESWRKMIHHFIEASKTHYPLSEFGFPKGRPEQRESRLKCALREFGEETGYDPRNILVPDQNHKITETFLGSDNTVYQHTYFMGILQDSSLRPKIFRDNNEVLNLGWIDVGSLHLLFRPYETSKMAVVRSIKEYMDAPNTFLI